MNSNSNVIISLCSYLSLSEDVKPYEPMEWSKLAFNLIINNLQPIDLYDLSINDYKNKLGLSDKEIERIKRLLDRSGSLAFEISKYEKMGIRIVTRADKDYPKVLKAVLKQKCPPIFYYAGDLDLLDKKFIGFVGSRTINEKDEDITKKLVHNVVQSGYGIVSGGAKGIDTIASEQAIQSGGVAVEFVSDSLIKKLKNNVTNGYIRNKKLLIISAVKPDAGFNVGEAMSRNKYIYASSKATVVIKSEFNKGGTWSGAIEALKNNFSIVYSWKNEDYLGNIELIGKGALPLVDTDWHTNDIPNIDQGNRPLTLFDFIESK